MKNCPSCQSRYDDDASFCPEDGSRLVQADPLIGRTIANRYRVMQRVGVGGMSTVYLARHALLDRFHAIKFLRQDLAATPAHRDRFLREAKAVNRINHPNIVEITDYGETDDGVVFLVMEYVPGEALAAIMARGPLPIARALAITEQIAAALGRAHQMGVIHRDLKPENILILAGEGRDLIKILDFGVAKLVDAPTITGTDQVFGTPGYIAPEMVAGEEVDGRSDLYGLAVMLYEMILGTLPYDWKYPGDLLVKRLTEEPVTPTERDPDFPLPLEKVVLRALSRQPSARHRDAFHLLEDLRATAALLPASLTEGWSFGSIETAAAVLPPAVPITSPKPPSRPPSTTLAPPGTDADSSVDMGPRDTPVSLPPLAHLVPMPSVAAQGGVHAAKWWRFRKDALDCVLEEFPVEGGLPPDVETAARSLDAGIEKLDAIERRAEEIFQRIDDLEALGRAFRSDLGQAVDEAARHLSLRRGEVETLAKRREELRERREVLEHVKRRGKEGSHDEALEGIVEEFARVEERLDVAVAEADEHELAVSDLRTQLGRRNEKLDRSLTVARGEVEALAREADGVASGLGGPYRDVIRHVSQAQGASERLIELERMSGV